MYDWQQLNLDPFQSQYRIKYIARLRYGFVTKALCNLERLRDIYQL